MNYACVLLLFGSVLTQAQDAAKPMPITMCELFEHPELYVGKIVKVRGASVGAKLGVSNATLDGPVKNCSAWLNVVVLFPGQVRPAPEFDVVRDESMKKLEDAVNSGVMRIDATYEGRFELLYTIHDGKRINLATGKEERPRVGKMSFYDARIVLHKVSDVVALSLPKK